ncbi:hypothetical protein DFJ74DRAFT_714365 [Hyaloraphidium curvatum]|nr:hypothetical protein DFJ74DRAFT_714365 [Hyaloraphidium curvatum]
MRSFATLSAAAAALALAALLACAGVPLAAAGPVRRQLTPDWAADLSAGSAAARQLPAAPSAASTPCAALPVAADWRCGPDFGARCPDGLCCSRFGWCQDNGGDSDPRWCGDGCQLGYGKCLFPAGSPVPDAVCPTASARAPPTTVSASTTVYAACTTVPEAADGRCGAEFGRRCPDGLCCSQFGYCQDDGSDSGAAWCGDGCQLGFGKCFLRPAPPRFSCPTPRPDPTPTYQLTTMSSSTPVYMACPDLPVTEDVRCGPQAGRRCPGNLCCSQWGFCQDDGGDSGEPWCGAGCELGWGKCFLGTAPFASDFACPTPTSDGPPPTYQLTYVSAATPVYMACPTLAVSTDGRCGEGFGTRCRDGYCCSQWGWCQDNGGDSGYSWCGEGCQLGFGKCFVGSAPLSTAFSCSASPTAVPETGVPTPPPASTSEVTPTSTAALPTTETSATAASTTVAQPTTTATPAPYVGLRMTADCPSGTFRVRNGNAFSVPYRWDVFGGSLNGSGVAAPGTTMGAIDVRPLTGVTVRLFVNGTVLQDTKAQKPASDCPADTTAAGPTNTGAASTIVPPATSSVTRPASTTAQQPGTTTRTTATSTPVDTIRQALTSQTLPCPAFSLGSGLSTNPMFPFISNLACDSPLATLRFWNATAFPLNFGGCNSQGRFDVLALNGTFVPAPDRSQIAFPAGVDPSAPQLDMDFYVTGTSLQRRNCGTEAQGSTQAPSFYASALRGRVLRLQVSCANGAYAGPLYFAWSDPQYYGRQNSTMVQLFNCLGGKVAGVTTP